MRYFLSNVSSPLKYNNCGNLISKQEFQHHRRTFDTYVLILVNTGTLYINQNGIEYAVKENQYIFLNQQEEHFGFKPSIGDLSYFWVHFKPESNYFIAENEIYNFENDLYNYFIIPEYGVITSSKQTFIFFNQLIALATVKNAYSHIQLNFALSLLVMEISKEYINTLNNDKNDIPSSIIKIKEWIRTNYYKNLSVKNIANEFGYNSDYISYLFKKHTNQTIISFINQTRIEISKQLLVNEHINIKEAAFSCGFTDDKYFSRTFKKYTGVSPLEYKKTFTN